MCRSRQLALSLLKERRPFPKGSPDWDYRTIAAWKHLQSAMGVPSNQWTNTPPKTTVRNMQ